jgi:type IV secretory pathway VirD2 relaxase
MEKDLGTKLDWVGVDHWNTEQSPRPSHRARRAPTTARTSSSPATTSRRGCAPARGSRHPGTWGRAPISTSAARSERQIEAERWTQLDRQLVRDAIDTGVIDLAPHPGQPARRIPRAEGRPAAQAGTLGLADQVGPANGSSEKAEATLRELGERGDIIKRMHRA